MDSGDLRAKKKTRFSARQSEELNALYYKTTHPSNVQRSTLLEKTGLTMTQVSCTQAHLLG